MVSRFNPLEIVIGDGLRLDVYGANTATYAVGIGHRRHSKHITVNITYSCACVMHKRRNLEQ